ncbi:MFS transporter [Janibacter alittae]|uniref:MFS transporter n=1 Tax=Janibacter alittae TaxID=3115209 RepID=A0ABZ2MGL6_9MICO
MSGVPLPSPSPATGGRGHSTTLALVALVLGGIGIGTTEFVTMGLLPEIAAGIDTSIPRAGHTISAYALGVVVGAPTIAVLGNRLPRRELLVALMLLFALGNSASALAPGYGTLLLSRFVAGIPHGAFFGIASIVAFDIVAPGRGGWAVSRIMLGIPIANVAGVPLATWLGQQTGWRSAYWLVAAIGLLTALLVSTLVPHQPGDREARVRSELAAFLDSQVWLTLLVGAVGFGGVFAMYSYISPILRNQTGLPADAVPIYLFIYGIGGLLGTIVAGRLVDRSVLHTLVWSTVATGASLALFAWAADWAVPAGIVLLLVCISVSAFVLALQLRLMEVAGRARTLGAAGNHAALNIANALGAWLGGVVLAAGWGWRAPSLVGAGLSAAGLLILLLSLRIHRGRTTLD